MVCSSGKVRHASRHAAKRALVTIQRRRSAYLRAYQCPECHGYHLTAQPYDRA